MSWVAKLPKHLVKKVASLLAEPQSPPARARAVAAVPIAEELESRRMLTTVSISAVDNVAEEYGAAPARYAFTRDNTTGGLVASYTISMGSAVAGDFSTSLAGTVSFESGSSTVYLDVIPVDDDLQESTESFTVRVEDSGGYTLGTLFEAPGEIQNNQLSATLTNVRMDARQGSGTWDATTSTFTVNKPGAGVTDIHLFDVTLTKDGNAVQGVALQMKWTQTPNVQQPTAPANLGNMAGTTNANGKLLNRSLAIYNGTAAGTWVCQIYQVVDGQDMAVGSFTIVVQ